jgi:hypothetical protein
MPEPEREVTFARLVDWMEGRLPEGEARELEEQLAAADDATLADLAWLRKFAEATRGGIGRESPPPDLRTTLVARIEAHAEGRRAPGLLKRVVAKLTSDTGLRPTPNTRRVGAHGSRRQLIYSSDTLDVALNFWPRLHDQNLDLRGQVFPRDDVRLSTFGVQLLRGGAEVATTVSDAMGGFGFQSVAPGEYEVILGDDRMEVSISPVELKP